MRCPTDQEELRIAERQGVEIDYCPRCRGVWLDRGELDKIIDRVEGEAPRGAAPTGAYGEPDHPSAEPGIDGLVRGALDAYRHRKSDYRDDERCKHRREGLRDPLTVSAAGLRSSRFGIRDQARRYTT